MKFMQLSVHDGLTEAELWALVSKVKTKHSEIVRN